MPLIKSGSRQAISTNIREMMAAGHPRKQAIAAALSTARKYADGGPVGGFNKWLADGPLSTEIEDRTLDYNDRQRAQIAKDIMMQKSSGEGIGRLARDAGFFDIPSPKYAPRERGRAMIPLPRPKPRFASGGFSGGSPWQERAASRSIVHAGMLKSNVPGRTDKLPITVGGGAFIVPADHLAALGQGNSQAGASIINGMFGLGGNKKGSLVKAMRPQIPKLKKMAEGGEVESKPVDIIAAGGEFVIPPGKVQEIGGGDLDRGHKILHQWVLRTRKQHIKTLKSLQAPKT
jgi:hypothetical protein